MYKTSTEIKVGIFVLITLLLFIWAALRVGGFQLSSNKTYHVWAIFNNASGLKADVSVELAGIQIGTISNIELYEGDKAKITMSIKDAINLPDDSQAFIKSKGILGDKYIEFVAGKSTEMLADNSQVAYASASGDVDDIFAKIEGIADDIKSFTSAISSNGGGEDVREIITNLKNISERLDTLTKNNEKGLSETLASLNKTMSNLEDITNKVRKGEGTLGKLLNDDVTVNELNSSLESIKEIANKINKGEGTLGKLVNDDTTIEKVNTALTGINDYLDKGNSFKIYVDYRADYLTRHDYLKSTVNIRVQPAPDRYYLFGVTSDYFGKYKRVDYIDSAPGQTPITRTDESWDRGKIKFNAQIAKRYYDLVVRGGIIESGAGLGLDYYLANDQLQLTFEAFSSDFDHPPHLRASASYNFWKIFYVSLGYDDFISDQHRASPFFGIGLRFNDDDLKYLLQGGISAVGK